MVEKDTLIKDLEEKLQLKNKELIQLRATQLNVNETEDFKRKVIVKDLKDCIKTQDLKMTKLLDPVSFDLSSLSKKIQNLKYR